jgi:hypothetical protein
VLLTLAGLRAGAERQAPPSGPGGGGGQPAACSPGGLEADLLLTADYPGQYLRGLQVMTNALAWVTDSPALTAGKGPDGDAFSIQFVELGFEAAAALVDMAGVKGCPFALLRVRGLSVGSNPDG